MKVKALHYLLIFALLMLPNDLVFGQSNTIKRKSGTKTEQPRRTNRPSTNSHASKSSSSASFAKRQHIISNIINNMVYVQRGSFMMGATYEQSSDAYGFESQRIRSPYPRSTYVDMRLHKRNGRQ